MKCALNASLTVPPDLSAEIIDSPYQALYDVNGVQLFDSEGLPLYVRAGGITLGASLVDGNALDVSLRCFIL